MIEFTFTGKIYVEDQKTTFEIQIEKEEPKYNDNACDHEFMPDESCSNCQAWIKQNRTAR